MRPQQFRRALRSKKLKNTNEIKIVADVADGTALPDGLILER
jgi:hypothetical protein